MERPCRKIREGVRKEKKRSVWGRSRLFPWLLGNLEQGV